MNIAHNYPSKTLQDAVEAISSLPGVGSRSALRLALHLLRQPQDNVRRFSEAIGRLATDVHYCSTCMMIADGDQCSICADRTRDHNTICVVESVRDVMSIEETGQYRGVYHVLGGIISPINGVGPSDLTILQLVDRIDSLTSGSLMAGSLTAENLCHPRHHEREVSACGWGPKDGFQQSANLPSANQTKSVEVILALSGDVEGETTSFYIYRQLERFGVRISTLARGLGFGDDLEYADSLTLGRSITNRQEFHP